jgi:Zn-dependent protease with chaperone function
VQPAIMTLQAWSRRAEVTCDRAALLAVRDLDKTLGAMVKLELGLDKASAFNAEEYLKQMPDTKKGIGRYAELFRSNPYVPKRVQALRLFAGSELYARVIGDDPTGKPSLPDVDKQVSDLISVF